MAFDGIITKSITQELKNIIGYKIYKIYEPDKNTILLGLYGRSKNFSLLACISAAALMSWIVSCFVTSLKSASYILSSENEYLLPL